MEMRLYKLLHALTRARPLCVVLPWASSGAKSSSTREHHVFPENERLIVSLLHAVLQRNPSKLVTEFVNELRLAQ